MSATRRPRAMIAPRSVLAPLAGLVLLLAACSTALEVSNGTHWVRLVKANRQDSGPTVPIRPTNPSHVMLQIEFTSSDPRLDADTIAAGLGKGCGAVIGSDGAQYQPVGAGRWLIKAVNAASDDTGPTCAFTVGRDETEVIWQLPEYPGLKVRLSR